MLYILRAITHFIRRATSENYISLDYIRIQYIIIIFIITRGIGENFYEIFERTPVFGGKSEREMFIKMYIKLPKFIRLMRMTGRSPIKRTRTYIIYKFVRLYINTRQVSRHRRRGIQELLIIFYVMATGWVYSRLSHLTNDVSPLYHILPERV